ncbi:hypothetical protein [Microseira wollei]|uniref:hypothetical protein n=1 Tax=Microseira wollei TaxID=467598 RepID=UPI001CFDDB58|nr:hypothetical protein [Microseira wollei]
MLVIQIGNWELGIGNWELGIGLIGSRGYFNEVITKVSTMISFLAQQFFTETLVIHHQSFDHDLFPGSTIFHRNFGDGR